MDIYRNHVAAMEKHFKLNFKRKDSPALYEQLVGHFRTRILDGTLPPGTRLPSELALVKEYDISRGTIRQAMAALVNEGFLERVPGRGTFVRQPGRSQSAASVRQNRIGLLLSYPNSELDLDIMIGVESVTKSRGYQVSLAFTEEDVEQQTQDIERLRADDTSGLIVFPLSDIAYDPAIWQLQEQQVPFVLIDRYFAQLDSDYVVSDNVRGAYRATEHLIILGHRRVAFCYHTFGTLETTSVRDRFDGYCRALAGYGLSCDENLVFKSPVELGGDPGPYVEFLSQSDRPSAIFTAVPGQVHAVMQAARQLSLQIPDDLALISFDDRHFAACIEPPLTVIAQSGWDMGARAAELIINRIEGQRGPSKQIQIPTSLIVRDSCGAKRLVQADVDGEHTLVM